LLWGWSNLIAPSGAHGRLHVYCETVGAVTIREDNVRPKLWLQLTLPVAIASATLFGCTSSIGKYRFRAILDDGFTGKLTVIENTAKTSRVGLTTVITQEGSRIYVPKGFTMGGTGHETYTFVDVYNKSGKLLSQGIEPPVGQVGFRGLEIIWIDLEASGRRYGDKYFFIFDVK